MDSRLRSYILYGLVLLTFLISLASPFVSKDNLWKKENNKPISFHGISFDEPGNISKFTVKRNIENKLGDSRISYDIEFEYTGRPTNMRVIGDLASQAFFAETPSFSKVNLLGPYEEINTILFDQSLELKDYYKNVDDYQLKAKSHIRVPLYADTKNYIFTLTYNPRHLVYKDSYHISDMAVFLTNARVDSFTDQNTDEPIKTESFVEDNFYVNQFERFTDQSAERINRLRNIGIGIFIVSVLAMLVLIWIVVNPSRYISVAIMNLNLMTFYNFVARGISPRGVLVLFPIYGFLIVLVAAFMSRDSLRLTKTDISQSLLGLVLTTILGLLVYVVPPTL